MRKLLIISAIVVSVLFHVVDAQEVPNKKPSEKETTRSDLRPPTNFILNTTVEQPDANFNISGDGIARGSLSADVISAETQYNLGGGRILSTGGVFNLYLGQRAGLSNTTGRSNTFTGFNAGVLNTIGGDNSFFGATAGSSNTDGDRNSFFGSGAGSSNTTGGWNSFFGEGAGRSNIDGGLNAFFGKSSGSISTGGANSFFGALSGAVNQEGFSNAFFGYAAGSHNTFGSLNTAIGAHADIGGNNITYATAIGADSIAPFSNSITLGRPGGEDLVRIPGQLVLGELSAAGLVPLCRNAFLLIGPCAGSVNELGAGHQTDAFKEQQSQIEAQTQLIRSQAAELDRQRSEINSLKKFICSQYPAAEFCQPAQ